MAAFHVLTLGLLGKKKKDPTTPAAPGPTTATGQAGARRAPANAVYTGDKAIPRDQLAAKQLGDTDAPDATGGVSANQAAALLAAQRTRRRAAAGNSGRATGGVSSMQTGPTAGGSPRSLIGY